MVQQEKSINAIKAVQDLIIYARSLSCQNSPYSEIAEFLDHLEYLPALIIEQEDNTLLFEKYLNSICQKYNCIFILNNYHNF